MVAEAGRDALPIEVDDVADIGRRMVLLCDLPGDFGSFLLPMAERADSGLGSITWVIVPEEIKDKFLNLAGAASRGSSYQFLDILQEVE